MRAICTIVMKILLTASAIGEGTLSSAVIGGSMGADGAAVSGAGAIFSAVSYTHLDVYKRQVYGF